MSKYTMTVMFIFCLQISISLLMQTGIFNYHIQAQEEWVTSVAGFLYDDSSLTAEINADISGWDVLILTFKSVALFLLGFAAGAVAWPFTLAVLGVPFPFYYYLGIPLTLTFILGLAEFIRAFNAD